MTGSIPVIQTKRLKMKVKIKHNQLRITDVPNITVIVGDHTDIPLNFFKNSFEGNESFLILRNPENNLTPQKQVEFTEKLIKVTSKDKKILIKSNSPYIVQGIRHFNDIRNPLEIAYYISEYNEISKELTVTDVTDDLNRVFSIFSEPMQMIAWG